MSGPSAVLAEIEDGLRPHGLMSRGVVNFDGDGPEMTDGTRAASVVLVGHIGSSLWPAFRAWRDGQADYGGKDPLDNWSKAMIGPLARRIGATAYYPFDAPYQPFQRWAMTAEGLGASPLGILIHPVFGLWHGYRGALGLAEAIDVAGDRAVAPYPCQTCRDKPCIAGCPASALTGGYFDVTGCRSYLATEPGPGGCVASGCAARAACPVGSSYRYDPEQIRFHMQALGIPKA
jgi:hypothetical protein